VTVEVRTREGTLIVANDKEVYLELTPSQVQQIRASPFAFQDNFPLVPGDYNISVILRNRVIHQYTVAEKEISIPVPDPAAPVLIDLIPAFESKSTMGDVAEGEIRTFQVGSMRFQPASDNIFVIGDTIHLVTQAFGASPAHKVVFELTNGSEAIKTVESPVGAHGMVFDHMMLEDMVGGNYDVRARLLSPEGTELSHRSVPVTVSPRSVATRPGFIYRRGFNTRHPGLLQLVRGEQLWNLGRYDEAKASLERAVAASGPNLPEAKWKLANAYLREKRADDAFALLRPLEAGFPNQFEVVSGLGYAFYVKGQCQDAVAYLDRARQIRPPDTLLLNTSGDCHQKLGHGDQAREAFELSLELDAEQPEVKERIQLLGGSPDKPKP
jgi:predicted negative regulator of RcsB-dependent stress response